MIDAGFWFRVSSGHQTHENQRPDLERFAAHHGYREGATYEVSDSAWKDGGGAEYKAALDRALQDAYEGRIKVLIIWALDRIVRDDENGAESALRLFRKFGKERNCSIISVQEPWLNGSPEVQEILISFAGWMSSRESRRRSERVKAGLARRAAEGLPIGRQPGAMDKAPRRRSGYVAAYEPGGARYGAPKVS